ncbi:MAG: lytic polysaccharide monooxygenase auxiliary activity family 9 protein [Planctomycetota bacterium]
MEDRVNGCGYLMRVLGSMSLLVIGATPALGHGTAVSPVSRVYNVYNTNLEFENGPLDFELADNAVALDGTSSYYTWNEVSRNIPEAVNAGLPEGFDYSPWVPDGHLASGGRVEGNYSGRHYEGLDQASDQWPTTPVTAGETIEVDFLATAAHDPSVWDVWMTTEDWDPNTALNWDQMEFLGRPDATLVSGHSGVSGHAGHGGSGHYYFDVTIPADREGHHVLWIAWQRDDPVGEVFFSTSDVFVTNSIPEPATAAFLLWPVLGAMATRRRSRG